MARTKQFKFILVHLGEMFHNAINGAGLTQSSLASHIGVPQSRINDICRGERGIKRNVVARAARLAGAFGLSTEFWYNLQKQFELDSLDDLKFDKIEKVAA